MLGFDGREAIGALWSQEEVVENFLGLRAEEDNSLVAVVFGLVLGRAVLPDRLALVNVAWPHLHDFAGPRADEQLQVDHCRNLPADVFLDRLDEFHRRGLKRSRPPSG